MPDKYTKVCPQCGSTNTWYTAGIGAGSMVDKCKECGFQAPVFPEMTEDQVEKFRELKKG